MTKRTERTNKDQEFLARQRKHHLESLERDNFVGLTKLDAIIASADTNKAVVAPGVPGPASLKEPVRVSSSALTRELREELGDELQDFDKSRADDGAATATTTTTIITMSTMPGGGGDQSHYVGTRSRSSRQRASLSSVDGNGGTEAPKARLRGGGNGGISPTKTLQALIQESGIASLDPQESSYLTTAMGPGRYPTRQFCSVCGWRGLYRCNWCGARYCGLQF
ncbi:hypothetical protein BGX29_006434 [Mortierella sp. GBA35]|nr:hypothetical protein BGX29_006434 [Mortierella sp. GBA35]